MTGHNPDISFANVKDTGFVLLTVDRETIRADYVRMQTVESPHSESEVFLAVETRRGTNGQVTRLEPL